MVVFLIPIAAAGYMYWKKKKEQKLQQQQQQDGDQEQPQEEETLQWLNDEVHQDNTITFSKAGQEADVVTNQSMDSKAQACEDHGESPLSPSPESSLFSQVVQSTAAELPEMQLTSFPSDESASSPKFEPHLQPHPPSQMVGEVSSTEPEAGGCVTNAAEDVPTTTSSASAHIYRHTENEFEAEQSTIMVAA